MTPPSPNEADRLLATHGADPQRWPASARAQIQDCDPAERAAEARLDAALDALQPPPVPPQLRQAVLALAQVARKTRRPGWRTTLGLLWRELGGTRTIGPAFALALVAGIGLGSGLGARSAGPAADGASDLLSLALLDDSYAELLLENTP